MKKKLQLVKLNIGSGKDYKKGFINIDAIAELKPDLVMNLLDPWPFKANSVNEIIAKDILEHFTLEQLKSHIIPEIYRVLKKGGTINIRMPNPEDIIKRFKSDPDVRNLFLYGDTSETGTFGAHKVGFTKNSLLYLLISSGLWPNSVSFVETNFVVSCVKRSIKLDVREITFSVSLNQLVINSFKNKPCIWVADPSRVKKQISENIIYKIIYKLFRNTPTLVLVSNYKEIRPLISAAHVSMAKIRTIKDDGLAAVIKETKIRHFIKKSF